MNYTLTRLMNEKTGRIKDITEQTEYVFLVSLSLLLPLLLRHPQILLGTAVNYLLISSAFFIKGWKRNLSLAFLPGISALFGNLLFGPFTYFLIFLLPFIWIGNIILIISIKYLHIHKQINYFIVLITGTAVKSLWLYLSAYSLHKLGVVPLMFLKSMGLFQFYTAFFGGLLVFITYKFINILQERRIK
ncbi:MAG: hypothetical protein KKH98_07435 [Spirochaetes bacterium]|nr:hypothetical protein [Spirochaetota bacterium]